MNPEMNTEPETQLREALQAAYPAAEVPETLRQRVSALAAATADTQTQNRQLRRRIGLRFAAVAVTVIAILAFLLPPKLTAVQAFQRMTASLRDVQSAHYIVWNVNPNGDRTKSQEVWYQAKKWRVEDMEDKHNQRVQVCQDGMRWTYDKIADTVTQDKAAFPDGFDTLSGFSIAAILHDANVIGNQSHVVLLGKTTEAGRPAHILLFYSQWLYDKSEPTWRSRIIVDDATDLPIRWEFQSRKPIETEWKTDSIREDYYNQKISESIFTPDFPKTAQLIDAIAGRDYWQQRLDKGIASQSFGQRSFDIHYTPAPDLREDFAFVQHPTTVVIRDFQVNAQGDVFLLFTANRGVSDTSFGTAELTDEFGTKYLDPSTQKRSTVQFIPTCADLASNGRKFSGFLFHNEQLEGKWWVPLQPQTPWKPRHFTLTLHLSETADGPHTVVFDLPVQRTEAKTLPGYMPYMARPLSDGFFVEEEAGARAYGLYHDAHDLPHALTAYHDLIALQSEQQRKSGAPSVTNVQEWFEIYHILSDMGRLEEAKVALLQAKKDDDVYSNNMITHNAIRTEMQKLEMKP